MYACSVKVPLYDVDSMDCSEDDSECKAFVDRTGEFVEVLCCDYGFRGGTARVTSETSGELPYSAWELVRTTKRGGREGGALCKACTQALYGTLAWGGMLPGLQAASPRVFVPQGALAGGLS